jgi:hypothetical protein
LYAKHFSDKFEKEALPKLEMTCRQCDQYIGIDGKINNETGAIWAQCPRDFVIFQVSFETRVRVFYSLIVLYMYWSAKYFVLNFDKRRRLVQTGRKPAEKVDPKNYTGKF